MKTNVRNASTDRQSIMYWGAIRSDGRKIPVKFPNTLNSISYLDILNLYNETMLFPGLVLQQDNAPVHAASTTKNFFLENEWEVLDWPPYSPNLNIIESLWAIVKRRIAEQAVLWEILGEKVQEIWTSIDLESIQKLCESISDRLKAVSDSNERISRFPDFLFCLEFILDLLDWLFFKNMFAVLNILEL